MNVLIGKRRLWYNDGTTNIGLANGSVMWFVPGGSTISTTSSTSHWMRIPTLGADLLILQYRSRLLTLGGLSAASGGNLAPVGCFTCFDDNDPDFVPHPTLVTPVTVTSSYAQVQGTNLWVSASGCYSKGSSIACSDLTPVAGGGVTVNNATTAVDDRFICPIMCGGDPMLVDNNNNSATVATWLPRLSVAGIEAVWVALSAFQTLTGVTSSTRIKAEWRALLFATEGIEAASRKILTGQE